VAFFLFRLGRRLGLVTIDWVFGFALTFGICIFLTDGRDSVSLQSNITRNAASVGDVRRESLKSFARVKR
jgi:hypothetical protein